MAPTLPLDDKRTLQAIGILADTLDDVSGAGVLDTVLVSKALRQVLATKSKPAFDFASRAFSTLDPEVKRQVAQDADIKARAKSNAKSEETLPASIRRPTTPSGGLLSAINDGGRGARRPGGVGGVGGQKDS
ncbi:MAG: hypothetical protein WCK65_10305 [Rhodospirillaceae bacterium]